MIRFKKIAALILSVLLIIGCLGGCKDSMDAYIYFELLQTPQTLDPQKAQSDSELLITRNIFEGLLRKNSDGKIVNGVITDYTYENLTYTFKLREGLTWSDGTPLTAYDFEYGFRRAINPQINAPFASRLKSIDGAEAIIEDGAALESLGVSAVDEYTLKITMCREDESFTETLTTSVCMPCNEEFFENSIGKYGLDAENILSNGSYRIAKWSKDADSFGIRLYKNEKYGGDFTAQNAAVFISCIDGELQSARLKDGDIDMAFLPCGELGNTGGLKVKSVNNICWILTISRDYSPQVRAAFAKAFSTDVYAPSLPNGFGASKSIYPEILGINSDGIGLTDYNIDEAKTIISEQIADMTDKKFPQATLHYYNESGVSDFATAIVGHWQQNLGTFINIKAEDSLSSLQGEIGESSLDFALFPITAKSDSFSEYAVNFEALSDATEPDTLQRELLEDYCVIPVAYQSTSIAYSTALKNVIMLDSDGYIDFSVIVKE